MKTKSFFLNKQFNIIFTMRHATRVVVVVVAKKNIVEVRKVREGISVILTEVSQQCL